MSQDIQMQAHRAVAGERRGTGDSVVARRLRGLIDGPVYVPGEDGYDEGRRPLSPAVDPRPAVVVEATVPSDIWAALVTARDHDLPFAVQATGHGTYVPADGGVLLKTTDMASVLVDPQRRIARVGPGARWSQVLAAAAPFGLAPLSGSAPSVGVTGYTLGGGVSWLSREYGFAADNVLRAEVLTANGRFVTASAHQHPDLFWALRGGGGNFGVVTSLEFRLHPVAEVYAGISYFPIERAAETLATYRELTAVAPDALSTAVVLTRIPENAALPEWLRGKRALGVKVMYAGAADDAERLLRPLRSVAGPALVDGYRSMSFADAAMGGTAAKYLDFFDELADPVLDILVDAAGQANPETAPTIEVRHWGGAMARPAGDAGPVGHRSSPFSVIVDAPSPGMTEGLRPYGVGGSFLNFLSDPTRVSAAYTPSDYQRLREVKQTYDPHNVFCLNHNIAPARTAAFARPLARA